MERTHRDSLSTHEDVVLDALLRSKAMQSSLYEEDNMDSESRNEVDEVDEVEETKETKERRDKNKNRGSDRGAERGTSGLERGMDRGTGGIDTGKTGSDVDESSKSASSSMLTSRLADQSKKGLLPSIHPPINLLTNPLLNPPINPINPIIPIVPIKKDVFNLLAVDDSALSRKMLMKSFRAVGHNCEEAEDGVKAITKVKEKMASGCNHYCAILMDFVMPNMDGPTAIKEIRALGYTAPIFGLTGNTLDSDITHFLLAGANKVLAKPLDTDSFNVTMKAMRGMREMERMKGMGMEGVNDTMGVGGMRGGEGVKGMSGVEGVKVMRGVEGLKGKDMGEGKGVGEMREMKESYHNDHPESMV